MTGRNRFVSKNEKGEILNIVKEAKAVVGKLPCMLNRFGECDEPAIQSHTLAASQLRLISEDGELFRLSLDAADANSSRDFLPRRIGVRAAGSFKGFCREHDQKLFRAIDSKTMEASAQNFELLFFRALAQEITKKAANVLAFNAFYYVDGDLKSDGTIESTATRVMLGLRDNFSDFDAIGHDRKALDSEVSYACYDVSCDPFFAGIGVINPEAFQIYFPSADPYDGRVFRGMLYCVLPTKFGHRVSFAWFKNSNRTVKPIFNRFSQAKENLLEFALQFSLEHCECTYFRPSIWDSLDAPSIDALAMVMDKNIDGAPYDTNWRPLRNVNLDFSYRFRRQHTNSTWAKLKYGRAHVC